MKFSNVYVDRNQLAEKLGVNVGQIAIAKVEHNLNDVTITVAVDQDAETKIDAVSMIRGESNARRFKLIEKVDLENKYKTLKDELDVLNYTYQDEVTKREDWKEVNIKISLLEELLTN